MLGSSLSTDLLGGEKTLLSYFSWLNHSLSWHAPALGIGTGMCMGMLTEIYTKEAIWVLDTSWGCFHSLLVKGTGVNRSPLKWQYLMSCQSLCLSLFRNQTKNKINMSFWWTWPELLALVEVHEHNLFHYIQQWFPWRRHIGNCLLHHRTCTESRQGRETPSKKTFSAYSFSCPDPQRRARQYLQKTETWKLKLIL